MFVSNEIKAIVICQKIVLEEKRTNDYKISKDKHDIL